VSQIASPFINPIRQERIDELAELEDEGHELPPVILDGPGEVEEVDYPEEKYPFLDGHFPVVGEDVWYVHDGHHRVTLAVQRGQRFIDALIIGTSNEMKQNGASPLDNPAFRRWFGDSKVVDEEGQPLVLTHSTTEDWEVFDLSRASRSSVWGPAIYLAVENTWNQNQLPNVKRLYVRSVRPLDLTRPLTSEEAARLSAYLGRSISAGGPAPLISLERRAGSVAEGAKAAGFDGIWHLGPGTAGLHLAVFDPRQIKSATDNVGTFDPDDPSIMRNPDVYPDAFVIVHLSSLGSLDFEAGRDAADRLLSDLWLEAREATRLGRQVIVIDQGWEGRVENRARREIEEAAPGAIWVHHDEDEDGWDDFESSFPKLLRKAGIGSAKVGGLWFDGCLDEVSKIMSAAGVKTLADPGLSVSYCDIGSEEGDEDDE